MSRRLVWLATLVAAVALPVAGWISTAGASGTWHPIETAFVDEGSFEGPDQALAFQRAADAGTTSVRLIVDWSKVAPAVRSAGFDPTNPDSPGYVWSTVDRQVELAVSNGLDPVLCIVTAPAWALTSPAPGLAATVPDPVEFGNFVLAAATHYSGLVPGVPRVRYWQVWNEPNLGLFLQPQFVNGQPYAPVWYRDVVNRTAAAVKSVNPTNLVIAGGTAPFYDTTTETVQNDTRWGPISFMRSFLCLSTTLQPTCATPARFDIWSNDPYTEGGPTHRATLADDASLGDWDKLGAVLNAAWAAGHITAAAEPQLWASEFSWSSNPPDPNGVPMNLLTRWISEAIYTSWSHGVTMFTWFLLRDQAPGQPYKTGMYTYADSLADAQPKAALAAFRFPFVAYRVKSAVRVWGRTPGSRAGDVAIEQQAASGWTQIGTLTADGNGILQGVVPTTATGPIRGRATDTNVTSASFSLRMVPDRAFLVNGHSQSLEPRKPLLPRPPIPPRMP